MARLIFDSNLWSYLSAEVDASELAGVMGAHGHHLAVPPITLGEVLCTQDDNKRRAIVELVTDRRWVKLASETELEAREIVTEVKRLRPEWLRAMRRTDRTATLHAFWTKRYWREARADPDGAARRTRHGPDYSEEIVRIQKANKEGWPVAAGDFTAAALSATFAADHPDPDPGSKLGWPEDQPALWWRVTNRDIWWYQLTAVPGLAAITGVDTTHADWFGASVDLNVLREDRAGFNQFWLFDVLPWNVPRSWWRSTLEVIQTGTKVTLGNPGDSGLVSHLPDCDYLLSADRRFVNLVQGAARSPEAPAGGVACRVEQESGRWLSGLQQTLEQLPGSRAPSMMVAHAERSAYRPPVPGQHQSVEGVVIGVRPR